MHTSYMHTCIHIHAYINTYMPHTYIHTYIYVCIQTVYIHAETHAYTRTRASHTRRLSLALPDFCSGCIMEGNLSQLSHMHTQTLLLPRSVWDLGRHVLLSVIPSTQVSSHMPPPSITGISTGSMASTVAVCFDASRERGGTRARRSTQPSQPCMVPSQQRECDGNAMTSQHHAGMSSQWPQSQQPSSQPGGPSRQLLPAVGNILSVCPDSGSVHVTVRLVAYEEVQPGGEAGTTRRSSMAHEEAQQGDEAGRCEAIHARGASVCSSGSHVAVACSGGGTFVWEAETGRQAASVHSKANVARPAGSTPCTYGPEPA